MYTVCLLAYVRNRMMIIIIEKKKRAGIIGVHFYSRNTNRIYLKRTILLTFDVIVKYDR